MNKTKLICAALALSAAATASAGGILTNTNQNIAFLRNPAQDAVIGIAGVYSNPAGVAFMKTDSICRSTSRTLTRHVR